MNGQIKSLVKIYQKLKKPSKYSNFFDISCFLAFPLLMYLLYNYIPFLSFNLEGEVNVVGFLKALSIFFLSIPTMIPVMYKIEKNEKIKTKLPI